MNEYTDSDQDADPEQEPSTAEPPQLALSHLETVSITSVWPTEAHHFTPWLLENAETLSELLGIDVELESREHKVGKFSLDILGKEVETQHPVIIENQFGPTDHTHLGQLLTYTGGTKPSTIVWIAEKFREEHRAALDWMNEHTDPDIRFFGVEIRVVTIAGAPAGLFAPSFDLVVKPNDWEKQVRAAASGSGTSVINELYQQFWSEFEPLAKERSWTNAKPPAQNWWTMPSGTTGVTWGVSFANFGARSEIYFEDADATVNTARFEQLLEKQEQIAAAFGQDGDQLIFDDLPDRKGCRIEFRLLGPKVTDTSEWPAVLDWLTDTQTRLRAAIQSVGGVPPARHR